MKRKPLYITAAILALSAVIFWPMRTRQELSWIDSVTGSMKRETISPLGRSSGEIIEPSPLELRLRQSHIPWTPDWRFLHTVRRNAFGRSADYECGTAPPIYQIHSLLAEFSKTCSDEDLRTFVKVMQTGTESEQTAAVDAAGEKGLQVLKTDPPRSIPPP